MGLVLESPGNFLVKGPRKSWNFLGYDVGGGHNDAGADAKIFKKISSDFICIYEKITGSQGSALDSLVTAVCLYI